MYHFFRDTTSENSEGHEFYKVLIDSDEGRAYVKLTTDSERLEFMRQHAHEKMSVAHASWHFYEDVLGGLEYNILIDSPEGREVDDLMADYDEKWDKEDEEKLLAYFKAHAHKVTELAPKPSASKI